MGLIKAAVGAVGGTLADQWKDYFYCDAMDADTLVVKGMKRESGRSSNKKGESNVITDGSGIAIADGQCMIIVEQGKVVELCAEPGVFTYNSGLTPSIFTGDLISNLKEDYKKTLEESLKSMATEAWERFQFGGGVGKDQRIYYFNTKEIVGNKYGTLTPIPFKVLVDPASGRFLPVDIRCNGEYSYRIMNPVLFYTTVCGNVGYEYTRDQIDSQLKTELLKAMNVAFGKLAAKGIDYSEIPLYADDLADSLNEALTPKWSAGRGIEIVSFGINSVSISEEDKQKLQNIQQAYIMSDPMLAAGNLNQATADALRTAAGNEAGAATGFMGMGFANMAGAQGGMTSAGMFAQAQQMQPQQPVQQPVQPQQAPAGQWQCACGALTTGKFCQECGSPKPAPVEGWTCSCGAVNKGKFCPECGSPKPAGAPLYQCDKCGWKPEDPHNPPKFCPECGDIFDDNDMKQ